MEKLEELAGCICCCHEHTHGGECPAYAWGGCRGQENAGLRLECEWLAEDRNRLDWLDQINRRTNEHYGTKYGWKFDINHNRAALTDHNFPVLTVREAIDAAKHKM